MNTLRDDTLHQVNTIANNLIKNERGLVQEESKHLRYLQRVSLM